MQFGSLPALIAAAVSLSDVDSVSDADTDSMAGNGTPAAEDSDVTRLEVRASAGFVIAIAALGILVTIFAILIRFCNIGLVNLKIKIFLIIVSWVCMCMRIYVYHYA